MTSTTPMAALLLLLLFPAIISLLIAPTTTATIAVFSDPFQPLNAGLNITDGEYTLSIQTHCSLALYKGKERIFYAESPNPTTIDCFVFMCEQGYVYVFPRDQERAPRPLFGRMSTFGRFAMVVDQGKLSIYGPAVWPFVKPNPVGPEQHEHHSPIIYSGQYFDGSSAGDVVVKTNSLGVSLVIRPTCTIAVLAENGSVIWSPATPSYKVRGQCRLELRSDGELVLDDRVTHLKGVPKTVVHRVWRSGFCSKATDKYVLFLRYNGDLVVYALNNEIFKGKTMSPTEGEIKMVTGAAA